MEDYIFGTLITDDLKLLHHRSHRRGLQHNYAINPRRPIPGKPVTLSVLVGADIDVEHVYCYYTLDGSLPEGDHGKHSSGFVVKFFRSRVQWETLTWGYAEIWTTEIPQQPDGTLLRYKIGAWKDGQPEIFADWPDPKYHQELATHAHFNDTPSPTLIPDDPTSGKTFSISMNRFKAPDWARQAVIYHIFIDRFFPGNNREWNKTKDLKDIYGGTLWGVKDKLDYLQNLGATAIWLSPTWPSNSYHGYDVTDYRTVAQRLGGEEAMHALIKEAHSRGIKIILDLVCNHTSNKHPYFLEALENPQSKYRRYYLFDESEIGYRTFFGVRSLPQVNLQDQEARAWMIDIARFWLREFKVDGFRLDHANRPGPEFWAEFQTACKEENNECFCFGEVVEPPPDYLLYSGLLDGLLDFTFNDSVRRAFAFNSYSREKFESVINRHREFFNGSDLVMPTFLDNHDVDRFLYITGGDKEKLRQAAEVQFEQVGPPIIYYGTEVGMSQELNDGRVDGLVGSREPMVWGDTQDLELLSFYRSLIKKRNKQRPWITQG